ncbi:MAG: single-stranded DNA-binding protein [Acidimicrobiales bacterium]|nr:single-stranded DNA-binding protein [Acidimicrobiales bacterium]MCB9371351.1 single-stranded DNA-binding protein [Microthrixaceae bacterium]
MNLTILRGHLSRTPESRTLASGAEVLAYEVTVPSPDGTAETVPVVWPDPPTAGRALREGDEVQVVGRVRRRFFRVTGATRAHTEVVADSVINRRHAKRCRTAAERALAAARDDLAATAGSAA